MKKFDTSYHEGYYCLGDEKLDLWDSIFWWDFQWCFICLGRSASFAYRFGLEKLSLCLISRFGEFENVFYDSSDCKG